MCRSILPFCFCVVSTRPDEPIRGKQTVMFFFLTFNDFSFQLNFLYR